MARTEERWDHWARRQLSDPDSAVRQLMAEGLSQDTAFIVLMLGKVHEQLMDLEDCLKDPPEDWREGRG